MSTKEESSKSFEPKNVGLFKILILIFMVLTAFSLALFFFVPILSAVIYDIGTILLIVAMYQITSKKTNDYLSWLKVSVLLVLAMVAGLLAASFATMYPYLPFISDSHVLTNLGSLSDGIGHHVIGMSVTALVTGVFMAVAALSFGGWFENSIDDNKQFKTFLYFGVIFLIGQIVTFLGYELLQLTVLQGLAEYQQLIQLNVTPIIFSQMTIIIGSILILISFVVEIIAGFQIYKKVSSRSNA